MKSLFTINQAARAHLISARELTAADSFIEAENEYRKSITLDPDDAEVIVEFATFLTIKIKKHGVEFAGKIDARCSAFLAMVKPSVCLRLH